MRVKDKVALVTGAGAGIGKASALLLAREGATVGVADFDAAAAEETTGIIRKAGGEAISVRGDVSVEPDCAGMVEAVLARWGRLDILCNIAGVVLGGILDKTTDREWNASMDVNLRSIYLCSKHAIPLMKSSGGGSIVNMASVAGLMGVKNRAAYSASKGGVIAWPSTMSRMASESTASVLEPSTAPRCRSGSTLYQILLPRDAISPPDNQ